MPHSCLNPLVWWMPFLTKSNTQTPIQIVQFKSPGRVDAIPKAVCARSSRLCTPHLNP